MTSSKQPNFLILWGDDIGQSNLSVFTKGVMGYRTPNIDRIAEEGMLFTDYYTSRAARPAAPRSSPASAGCEPA